MARTTSAERWLSVSEAGRALGLSRTSLLSAEDAGLLTPMRTPGGHRRYRPEDLRCYLRAAGARTLDEDGLAAASPPDPTAEPASGPAANVPSAQGAAPTALRAIAALDMATALRAAVRPIVRALEAECGGVYLRQGGTLGFCAGFGVPRWLTERLGAAAAPAPLLRALEARHPHQFDPAATAFPEPRSSGHGVAVAMRPADVGTAGDTPAAIGVLFVVRAAHPPLPGELRTLGAFAELVTRTVADRARIADLEHQLACIAALATLP